MRIYFAIIFYFFTIWNVSCQEKKTEYADLLVEAYYSNAISNYTTLYGGTAENFPVPVNAEVILGDNTANFVSLPSQSYVVVRFTDNQIIDYPNQHDIFITEKGCSGERADVFISTDGVDFVKLGTVDDCRTSSLDLNKINFKSAVRFIKIVGLDARGGSPGFDLVNIKGLANSSVDTYVDFLLIEDYLKNSEEHLKKVILNNVNFDSNSAGLNEPSKESLTILSLKLKQFPDIKFRITGHSDNVGAEDLNIKLSYERAKSVSQFLISKGINKNRVVIDGKGQLEPIKSNETDEGRNLNRRVELEIID